MLKDKNAETAIGFDGGSGQEMAKLHSSRVGWALVALALCVGIGCSGGSSKGPVGRLQGKVTINGKPVPDDALARVFFVPPPTAANRSAAPSIAKIVSGSYVAEDVPVGAVNVTFEIQRFTGKENDRGIKEFVNLLPEQYQSGLSIDVTEGDQTRDFQL